MLHHEINQVRQAVTGDSLAARDLGRTFGRTQALRGVSVGFVEGVNGILGPNGAGKTTLFRILTGALRPTSGSVLWQGESLRDRNRMRQYQRQVGYLPQDPGWFEGFTVMELCGYFAALRAVPRRERSGRVAGAIDMVGLGAEARKRLKDLSGGQRRRAFIAQTLVHDPGVIVLDEPTSGLDPIQRVQLRELVADLGQGRIVLLSTHLVEDVAQTARRVFVLETGRLVWQGSPAELSKLGGRRGDTENSVTTAYERGFLATLEEPDNDS